MTELNDHSVVEGISHVPNHIKSLKEEIAYLKTQLQPTDTGHIHTALATLEHRVRELSRWLIHNY